MYSHVRENLAYLIAFMFFFALYRNPSDNLLLGALIGAFSGGAVGFYLGGSKTGSETAKANAETVTQVARATPSVEPQSVTIVNDESQPVPVEAK
jgi:hypothetical protein